MGDCPWQEYLASIQTVCPWSLQHYRMGRIDVVTFVGIRLPLRNYSARIYTCDGVSSATLNEWQERLNELYARDEWFYSHPSYGGYSSPRPILVQQSHAQLNKIRKTIKKTSILELLHK